MLEKTRRILWNNYPQIIAAFSGTLSILCNGMQASWSSPMIPRLKSDESPIKIDENDEFWLETTSLIGGMLILPIALILPQKIGRKKTILTAASIGIVAWMSMGFATNVYTLLCSRFVTGMTGETIFVSACLYTTEIAHPDIRGFLSGMVYLMLLSGTIMIYVLSIFFSILGISIINVFLLSAQLVCLTFQPESPYYLIHSSNVEAAKKSLDRLRQSDTSHEFHEICEAVKREKNASQGNFRDLFLVKSNRKAVGFAFMLGSCYALSGWSVMMLKFEEIMNNAGSTVLSAENQGIFFAVCMLIFSLLSTSLFDKFGRKTLFFLSEVTTAFALIIFAVYLHLEHIGILFAYWIPLIFIVIYTLSLSLGITTAPGILVPELFPTNFRSTGMVISELVYSSSAIFTVYVYRIIVANFNMYLPFYIFAASCMIFAIITAIFLPETKEKSFDQIQILLNI